MVFLCEERSQGAVLLAAWGLQLPLHSEPCLITWHRYPRLTGELELFCVWPMKWTPPKFIWCPILFLAGSAGLFTWLNSNHRAWFQKLFERLFRLLSFCIFSPLFTFCVFFNPQQDDERIIQEIQKEGEAELNKKTSQSGQCSSAR